MRAAVLTEYNAPPAVAERDELEDADGRAIVELRAAGLNPPDLAIASGTFPAGSPPLPAERFAAADDVLVEVPDAKLVVVP